MPTSKPEEPASLDQRVITSFLSAAELSSIKMPWESPLVSAIFGKDIEFSMPRSALALLPPAPIRIDEAAKLVDDVSRPKAASSELCKIKHVADFDVASERPELSQVAIQKWSWFLTTSALLLTVAL